MQRSIGSFLACSVLLGGCASWSDAQKGTAIGAGTGALIGNAVGGGVLSGSSPIGILRGDVTTDILLELPLSMIPTFAVPFWIVLHIISLIKLRNAQAAVEEAAA